MLELLLAISILWLYPCAFVALDRFARRHKYSRQLFFIQEHQSLRSEAEQHTPLPIHEVALLARAKDNPSISQQGYLLAQRVLEAARRPAAHPTDQQIFLILAQTRELALYTLQGPIMSDALHRHAPHPPQESTCAYNTAVLLYPAAASPGDHRQHHRQAAPYQPCNSSFVFTPADLRQLAKKLNHIHIPSTRRAPLLTNNQN